MPEQRDDDWVFSNHPDLIDPRWQKKLARRARRQARRVADDAVRARLVSTWPRMRVLAIVLGSVVIAGGALLTWHDSGFGPAPTHPAASATTTPALDLAHPYANTPAASWSDGEAGIRPPAAQPVGNFSAASVAADLVTVKQVLVAAHLSPMMLFNHDTSAYLALFGPYARASEQKLVSDPGNPDRGGALTLLAAGFRLLPVPVKVDGSMSVSVSPQGNVRVHTNYVFAYAFAPPDPNTVTQPWQLVAVRHVAEDFDVVTSDRYPVEQRGVYAVSSQAYDSSMACRQSKRGFLAPAYSEISGGAVETESPYAYYDPGHSLDVHGC